ncbi:helix-turn-helix domain-containing protein [Flavobacterium alkalisoli]|uniref:Helix-turn-helix domain-containing protein n=1 Tax=Flavobacterium alkalisoli TaxID=2602769 RepID=A0A5B9FYS2_9FLAO|nr:helix-turn-helix transcriptional regulator [Flavobacterium alkalisoli]QEE50978.1 helix-turn-helix domain-containing protein [Flavobacterium alkalisoli]
MTKKSTQQTPIILPHPNRLLVIEPLDYPNPYDFSIPHRHDYFEIILIESGKGHQYIDFKPYEMKSGQLYNVYPGQVHLMHRHNAQGLLIQFRKDLFEFIQPLQHYNLYISNPVFNPDAKTFSHLYSITQEISALLAQEDLPQLGIYKAYSYLQIILISISEMQDKSITLGNHHLVSHFLSLLSQNIYSKRKVTDYCEMIKCSHEKLNNACKSALGKTTLELIHEELMLEIRRLFLLSPLSLKEIAFELNFDSQANFSIFIKNKTGLTPSELQTSILKNS